MVLASIEALNGLLLIGWSASFIFVAMERFRGVEADEQPALTARTNGRAAESRKRHPAR